MPPQGEPGIPRPSQDFNNINSCRSSHLHLHRYDEVCRTESERGDVHSRVASQHLARDGGHETPAYHEIRHCRTEEALHRRFQKRRAANNLHRELYRRWRAGVRSSEAVARKRGTWLTQRWCWKPLYTSAGEVPESHSSHSSHSFVPSDELGEHRGEEGDEDRECQRAARGASTRLSECAGVCDIYIYIYIRIDVHLCAYASIDGAAM